MKLRAWLGGVGFGLALVVNGAETPAPAVPPAASRPTSIPVPPPVVKPAPKEAAKPAPKKEEPMGKIAGTEIKRGAGYMGLELVGGTFKITFYDAKRKPMAVPPEITRAALRWAVSYRQGLDERAVLNPSEDGKSLTSLKVVKPPHNFRLYITLLAAATAEDGAGETYSIDFRG
jgi:hypothetical protein